MHRAYFVADRWPGARWLEGRMIEAIYPKGGKRWLGVLFLAVAVAMLSAGSGHAQSQPTGGQVVTPGSSIEKPGDMGVRAHTNFQILIPNQPRPGSGSFPPDHAPQVPGLAGTEGTARSQ
jgi:hypothetical protein